MEPPVDTALAEPSNASQPNSSVVPASRTHPIPVPTLPPQLFTTAAQLLDLTDKKLLLSLRDGRKIIGILRTWDQFANLVLQDATERIYIHSAGVFGDIPRGIFIVRGENVQLLGEIDLDTEDDAPEGFKQLPPAEIEKLHKADQERVKTAAKRKVARLKALGFEAENVGEMMLI